MGRNYFEPLGYDLDHTYRIQIGQKEVSSDSVEKEELTEDDLYNYATTFMDRIKRHPDVENVSLSEGGMPFGFSQWSNSFHVNTDSLSEILIMKMVTTSFFDVFKMKTQGRIFNWEDHSNRNQIMISPGRNGFFGEYPNPKHILTDVQTINFFWQEDAPPLQVIGTVNKVKDTFFDPIRSTIFKPIVKNELNLAKTQNIIRIKPSADKGFEERFTKDMESQLNIGPFFLVSVTSLNDIKRNAQENMYTSSELNSVYAITAFLIISIFLGIIGTFWYRTQSRRSEVGLRIALGATKKNVRGIMFLEALLLLFIASLVAVNVCINIGQTDFLKMIGVPVASRVQIGAGIEQEFINYALTFLFLAVVSFIAVWYPAKQASDIPPAEALREE